MAGMTTDKLIIETLRHDAKATAGPWRKGLPLRTESGIEWVTAGTEIWSEDDGRGDLGPLVADTEGFVEEADMLLIADYRTAAPLLARKLQRALEVLRCIEDETAAAGDAAIYLDEIEAME